MHKTLLIGSNGQLGSEIILAARKHDEIQVTGLNRPEIDVRDPQSIENALAKHKPDSIINTAAFHQVDLCEDKAIDAFATNSIGAMNLARLAKKFDCKLVHFSTDHVFFGKKETKAFTETDKPNPKSVYSLSKYSGEVMVSKTHPDSIIVRTCGLFGEHTPTAKQANFPQLMINLAKEGRAIRVVDDQICTPTWTKPLAEVTLKLATSELTGAVHATCNGSCSWYEFARYVLDKANLETELTPVSSEEYGAKAERPYSSILENSKLKDAGLDIFPTWQEALDIIVPKLV